jgi:hypothetical protein
MERLSGRGAAEKKVRRQMGKVERSVHAIGRLARRAASAARNRDRISHTCAATIETLSRIPMRALEGFER